MAKVFKNLDTEENRKIWLSVQVAAERVNRWPRWMLGDLKKIPERKLLQEKLLLLSACKNAAEKELHKRVDEKKREIDQLKTVLNSEIQKYRGEIKKLEKCSAGPMKEADKIVGNLSDSKKKLVTHRLGLSKL